MAMLQEPDALTADQLGLRLERLPTTPLAGENATLSSRAESISEGGFEERIAYALLPSPRDPYAGIVGGEDLHGEDQRAVEEILLEEGAEEVLLEEGAEEENFFEEEGGEEEVLPEEGDEEYIDIVPDEGLDEEVAPEEECVAVGEPQQERLAEEVYQGEGLDEEVAPEDQCAAVGEPQEERLAEEVYQRDSEEMPQQDSLAEFDDYSRGFNPGGVPSSAHDTGRAKGLQISVPADEPQKPMWHHAEGGLIGQKKLRQGGGIKPKAKAKSPPSQANKTKSPRPQASRTKSPPKACAPPSAVAQRSVASQPRYQPRKVPVSPAQTDSPQRRGLVQIGPTVTYPANHPKSLDPPKKYEPAKVRCCADGRAMLRGVNSTSDLEKYAGDLELHTRTGQRTREAFKTMRARQHNAIANNTWSAFHNLKASEQGLDDWLASAKS